MEKFRRKPTVIEAEQWLGTIKQYNDLVDKQIISPVLNKFDGSCTVMEPAGERECNINDWIVTGPPGTYFVCQPEIFDRNYEKIVTESYRMEIIDFSKNKSVDDFEQLGTLIDELDNLAHGLSLPVGDGLHVNQLKKLLPEKVEKLKQVYVELSGENPWE